MRKFFLTFGFVGCIPFASGTFGTIAALPFAFLILYFAGANTLFLVAIFLFLVGVKEVDKYEKQTNIHDDKRIVIDEVVGVFLALCICNLGILGCFFSFLFFRVFDILKPSIIGRIDKQTKGGMGVMLDDALAGVFAGILSSGFCFLMIKMKLENINIFGVKLLENFFIQ